MRNEHCKFVCSLACDWHIYLGRCNRNKSRANSSERDRACPESARNGCKKTHTRVLACEYFHKTATRLFAWNQWKLTRNYCPQNKLISAGDLLCFLRWFYLSKFIPFQPRICDFSKSMKTEWCLAYAREHFNSVKNRQELATYISSKMSKICS